jgi:DNA-binding response OmpR family regulator
VPLIVLARPGDERSCQQALELGATEYLEKPVSSAELDGVIKKFLESSPGE